MKLAFSGGAAARPPRIPPLWEAASLKRSEMQQVFLGFFRIPPLWEAASLKPAVAAGAPRLVRRAYSASLGGGLIEASAHLICD